METMEMVRQGSAHHSVVVLRGRAGPEFATELRRELDRSSRRRHGSTVIDLRQFSGMTPEAVRVLLGEYGSALDRERRLILVVRDDRHRRCLEGLGLWRMVPMVTSRDEADAAARRRHSDAAAVG